MERCREARLRPEFADLYPVLPPGVWMTRVGHRTPAPALAPDRPALPAASGSSARSTSSSAAASAAAAPGSTSGTNRLRTDRVHERHRPAGGGVQVGVGIVLQRAGAADTDRTAPAPAAPAPRRTPGSPRVSPSKNARTERSAVEQARGSSRVVADPAPSLRRHRPHHVHPLGDHGRGRGHALEDRAAGERVSVDVDQVVVELRPGVVPGDHVHRVVVVQEVERERPHPARALILQIERRRAPERGEQRIGGERARGRGRGTAW